MTKRIGRYHFQSIYRREPPLTTGIFVFLNVGCLNLHLHFFGVVLVSIYFQGVVRVVLVQRANLLSRIPVFCKRTTGLSWCGWAPNAADWWSSSWTTTGSPLQLSSICEFIRIRNFVNCILIGSSEIKLEEIWVNQCHCPIEVGMARGGLRSESTVTVRHGGMKHCSLFLNVLDRYIFSLMAIGAWINFETIWEEESLGLWFATDSRQESPSRLINFIFHH